MPPTAQASLVKRSIELLAHPLLLAGAWLLWLGLGRGGDAVVMALVASLVVLMLLEATVPAKRAWRLSTAAYAQVAGLYLLTFVLFGTFAAVYEASLLEPLAALRERLGLGWPDALPLLAQSLLLYFASDFIYYWIHRAIHRWGWLWRASGHGFHHAFHKLHALHVGTSHPLEVLLLALPMVLVAASFGAGGEAVAGASVLLAVNAAAAHANLGMDTPVFNWLFTSSNQHRRHHSAEFDVSNTNFGCNAILWDRLFGTFSRGDVAQTGIGPREPSLAEKFMLPFREPDWADTAASRARQRKFRQDA